MKFEIRSVKMKTIHYYTNTFGSKGHYSFFDSNFGDLDTCITLNCYPTSAMEKIIALIQTKIDLSNEQLEIVHNFLDNSVEGLKIPHLGTGVYNFPVYAPSGYHIADVFNSEYLKLTKAQLNEAYKYFKEAHSVHDDWEKIYISQMDFDAVNQLTEDTIERIIGLQKLPKKGKSVDRFFGAATINGPNDYINNITEGLEKRCLSPAETRERR